MRPLLVLLLLSVFYTVRAQNRDKVHLLCNWNDTTGLRPHFNQYYNDVWGFSWKGREYAAIGSTEGVHIVDVNNCRQVAFHEGSTAGEHVVHRDFKTYKNYLYAVCDEGDDSRLQIFDFSYLPDSIHQVYESIPEICVRAHNIFIDTITAKIYLCGRNRSAYPDALNVYSLLKPEQLLYYGHFNDPFTAYYVHDVYVRNDTAYCSAGNQGYVIVSFVHPLWQNNILGILPSYDYKGYNHSSWVNTRGIGVMADETAASPMKVIDVNDPSDIKVRSYFSPRPGDSTCMPHNPYILNDDYVLIAYYRDGLQIYNISNPDSPYRAGYYDESPGPEVAGFSGAWGCYPYLPSGRILISDMQTGLYVLDADSALNRLPKDEPPAEPAATSFKIYPNPVIKDLQFSVPDTGTASAAICDISHS